MFKSIIIMAALAISLTSFAGELRVAAGAGYKGLVEDWAQLYESKTGNKAERMYGNMGQVIAQVKLGGGICAVIGENGFLKTSGIEFASFNPIGKGILALVTRKGLVISDVKELVKPEYGKIAIPDVEKAIYGKAASQLITNMKMTDVVNPKLIPAGTVPRSGSYALTGEADAAFINVSFAEANKDKLGSVLVITDGYKPLDITAAVLPDCANNAEMKAFIGLLGTPEMKKIVKQNGL